MKGRLFLKDDKWYVEYQVINSFRSLPLHPDSERMLSLRSDKQPIHIIGEKVEFELVHAWENGEVGVNGLTYAKLTQSKGLNLEQLETKLDKALANETEESITTWLSTKRKHSDTHFIPQEVIEFTDWIARDWMSIWVESKWMWEYQKEVGPYHPYHGYLTSEQLLKMYLVNKNKL